MNINDLTITTYENNIVDLPNQVTGEAQWLKEFFDGRGDKEIKASINGIISALLNEDTLRADAVQSGGMLAITSRSPRAEGQTEYNVQFDAPADYAGGGAYTIDGAGVTLTDMAGNLLSSGWKAGAPVLLARRGNRAWLIGGGGSSGSVAFLSSRAPGETDDESKGFVPGSLWLEQSGLANMVDQVTLYSDNAQWSVHDAFKWPFVVPERRQVMVALGPSAQPYVGTFSLNYPVMGFAQNHIYYGREIIQYTGNIDPPSPLTFQLTWPAGRSSGTLAEITDRNEFTIDIYGTGNGNMGHFSHRLSSGFQFKDSDRLNARNLIFVDLTEALGAGNEWDLERCREFFGSYPDAYDGAAIGNNLYMCVYNTPGAAVWRKLAFAEAVDAAVAAANQAATLAGAAATQAAAAEAVAQAASSTAALASQNATQAAQTATQAAQQAQTVLEEGMIIHDPVSLTDVPTQQAMENLYGLLVTEGALTVDEYDALDLSVDQYDLYGLTVTQYDTKAKQFFGG